MFYSFENELASLANDIDLFQSRARAFLTDLIQTRQANPELEVVSQFLQFYVASCVLRHLMGRKMMNYLHDWLCNSISDDVGQACTRRSNLTGASTLVLPIILLLLPFVLSLDFYWGKPTAKAL